MSKILIVDTKKNNRKMLADILQGEYEIAEAENGAKAWESIRKERKILSVVLLSLDLPEMDGFQIIENMKKSMIIDTLPVVVISENRQQDVEGKCLELGVADFSAQKWQNSPLVRTSALKRCWPCSSR